MKIEEAIHNLYSNVSASEICRDYFRGCGVNIDKALSVSDDYDDAGIYKSEGELYIENIDEGFCFLFKTENHLIKSKQSLPITEGDWYFTKIFLYSEGKDDYREFLGVMPYGILWIDTVQEIINKVGRVPDFINEYVHKWDDLDGISLSLSSIKDNQTKIIIIGKSSYRDTHDKSFVPS
jgi:hypothetical protein